VTNPSLFKLSLVSAVSDSSIKVLSSNY